MGHDAMNVRPFVTHLDPTGPAVIADTTTVVMEHDDAVAFLEQGGINALAHFFDDAAGFVAGDDGRLRVHAAFFKAFEAERRHEIVGVVGAVKV